METGGDRSLPPWGREGKTREGGPRWKTVLCVVQGDRLVASSVLNLEVIDGPIPKSSESIQQLKPELTEKAAATKAEKRSRGRRVTLTHRAPLCCSVSATQTCPGDLPQRPVLARGCCCCFGLQPVVPCLLLQLLHTHPPPTASHGSSLLA